VLSEAKPQPTNDLVHVGVKNCRSGGIFVAFPKNKCNFLHTKNKHDFVRRSAIPHRAASCEEFSLWTVAAIALWKSAPMV